MQQFIEIPSVLIKDTMMKGMKGVSEPISRLMEQYILSARRVEWNGIQDS